MRSAIPGVILEIEEDQLLKEWGGGEPKTIVGGSDCTGKSEMKIGFSLDLDKPNSVR